MFGLRRIVILYLSCFTSTALAQVEPSDRLITTWIKELSVKKDPLDRNLKAIAKEITATDTSTWCLTMSRLDAKAQHAPTRCQIRVSLLRHFMTAYGLNCPQEETPIEYFPRILQSAYEIEDEVLQYKIHLSLGQIYNSMQQYGQATMHFQMLFDILHRHDRKDFFLPSGAFYDMSYSLYHAHEYAACIKAGLNAMAALPNASFQPDDTLNGYQQMLNWNTIGLAYHKIQQPDSAFQAFTMAEQLAKTLNNAFWIAIINGNKGDVYFDLGQYDSAYVLLQKDYHQSVTFKQYDNAANSLQWLARIDVKKGRSTEGIRKLQTARQFLYQTPQPNYLANVYFAFSQAYASLGKADSVNMYLQKYLHLHDSLVTEVSNSRAEIVQMRLSNVDHIQTIKILNRQKRQISLTRNFTIAIVVLLGCLGYMWLTRMRLKMQIRQREALEGKRIAEAEAQKAIEQLDVFRQHLLEKNDLIEKWQTAYEIKENTEDHIKRLSDLSHHLILKEEDWVQFKELFDSVYPGFFMSLRNKVPDITQAEQRMAALGKLKLTAKEAANLLGVSPNTVYKTRQRLRQRLGLESDGELDAFFEGKD